MGISNIPFPSFTLVLTSDHVIIPGRSMVIRIEPLLIKNNLMKTVDLHNPQSENLLTQPEGALKLAEPALPGIPEGFKQATTHGGVKFFIRLFKKAMLRRAELTTD